MRRSVHGSCRSGFSRGWINSVMPHHLSSYSTQVYRSVATRGTFSNSEQTRVEKRTSTNQNFRFLAERFMMETITQSSWRNCELVSTSTRVISRKCAISTIRVSSTRSTNCYKSKVKLPSSRFVNFVLTFHCKRRVYQTTTCADLRSGDSSLNLHC